MKIAHAIRLADITRIARLPLALLVVGVVAWQYMQPWAEVPKALQPTEWGWDLTATSLTFGGLGLAVLTFLEATAGLPGMKRLWETGDWAKLVHRMRRAMYGWMLLGAIAPLGLWGDVVAPLLWGLLTWAVLLSLEAGLWLHGLLRVLETPQRLLEEVPDLVLEANPNPVLSDHLDDRS